MERSRLRHRPQARCERCAQVSRLAVQNATLSAEVDRLKYEQAPMREEIATLHVVKSRLAEEVLSLLLRCTGKAAARSLNGQCMPGPESPCWSFHC